MIVGLCVSIIPKANAQTFYSNEIKSKISHSIRFSPGTVSVDTMLLLLEKKFGITFQMSPYLRGHKFYLNLNSITVLSLLSSICMMEGWRWYESVTPGVIVIRNEQNKPISSLNGLPDAIQGDLSKDIRKFITNASNPISMQPFNHADYEAMKAVQAAKDPVSTYI